MDSQHSPRGFAPATITDRRLAITLTTEDRAEEDSLNPLERITCRTHRRWLHDCVAIDQLAGDVSVHCPSCGETTATRRLVRACRASLAAAHDH